MKLPAFQLYPADWKKDAGVQALSFHDRGVWFEMLCLMHESEQRGKLLLNGKPMPVDALASILGLDNQILTTTLSKLEAYGVYSVCETTGAIMSRRMVRDEEIIQIRRNAGKQGGNPILLKQNSNQKPTTRVKQKPTPSSSSSISSSYNTPNPTGELLVDEVLPSNWKRLTRSERGRMKVKSNNDTMKEIGSWFGKLPETLWTIDEYIALTQVAPTAEQVKLVGEFYSIEIEDKNGYRRTAIITLLNNWSGEMDKARNFFAQNPHLAAS